MEKEFKIEKIEYKNKIIVEITGDLDISNIILYYNTLCNIIKNTDKDIILNLEKTTYMDSSGIGYIVKTSKKNNMNGIEGIICDKKSQIYETLNLVGVDKIFHHYNSKKDIL